MKDYSEFSYYTFGMIKPDSMEYKEEIVKMILCTGLKIDYYKCELESKNSKSKPVLMMIIYDSEGDAVKKLRRELGLIGYQTPTIDLVYEDAVYASASAQKANEDIIKYFENEISLILHKIGSRRKLELANEVMNSKIESVHKHTIVSNYIDDTVKNITMVCDDYAKKMGL